MAILSFKDVGVISNQNNLAANAADNVLPIGFKTPLETDDGSSIFKMHYNLADQITDNLRNLILTNHGERLAFYDFGANIRPLLTDFTNKDNFDAEAMARIKKAATKYMPFVELIGFESNIDRLENVYTGIIKILIIYKSQLANIGETGLEITLFIT
jgi:hypothetical protein